MKTREQAQKEFIRKNYLSIPIKSMARIIGRSQTFVKGYMDRNFLVVPREVIEERKRLSQFSKGHKPFNKGLKRDQFLNKGALERVKATQFKSGHLPHNTKHDGAISIRESKGIPYAYVRTSVGKWRLLHREVWKQTHGSIPKGFNVQFKDGNTLNCQCDNLYLIHRKHQAVVNKHGGRSLPHELVRAITLTQKLIEYEKQDH